ncbi:MAG: M14 family metallopeptidase [Bacteroidia bacterium]|nr:M14 family metallopeptidase [Bacteroidia bacterium]
MKIHSGILVLAVIGMFMAPLTSVMGQYQNYDQISKKIEALGRQFPDLCSVKSLVKTAGGKDIWLITIGIGTRDSKPGVAVVGGIDGKYLTGRELALGFADSILKNSSENDIRELLSKITFYVIPDVSPDASDQYFSGLKYERSQNSRTTDEDRDFLYDEDPCEDLNKDGLITLIRIKDPAGSFIESDEDKRVMVTADISKGQTGSYLVYSEGTDNDKDGRFNEDGAGGVNFNRNLTYNYEEFGVNAGLYPVSEPETRAVVDFLFDRFNIYMVFSFGPQDNLGQPMKASERTGTTQDQAQNQPPEQGMMRRERGRITSILKTDELINKLVSDKYHEITGFKGAPPAIFEQVNFMEWAYFHYGRYSFSTPGWWLAVEKGKSAEAAFLKFADKINMKDAFVPWTPIVHPDFPGKTVEVGGIRPFAVINPPQDTIGDLISLHYKFITAISAMHPELEFLDIKVEDAGENIFRLSLKVHNKGLFATNTEVGEPNIWTRIMRLSIEPSGGQTILSGLNVQRIQRLQGDESAEFSWLISGKGRTGINAGAANVGQVTTSIELK